MAAAPALVAASRSGRSDLGWLILLGALWGSAFPVIRLGLLAGASPFALGAVRFGVAAAVMAGIAALRRERFPGARKLAVLASVGGALFIGAYAAFLNTGEQTVPGGLAAVLVGTIPLWTALFGLVALPEERVGRLGGLGLGAGFAGLLVLFLPAVESGVFSNLLGEVWVLGAALAGTLGAILLRRLLQEPPGTWGLTVQFAVAAAVLAALTALPGAGRAFPVNPGTLFSVLYLALGASVGGYAIYFGLLHRVGALGANLVAYVNPLAGVLIGIVLLGESVTAAELGGFALVLVGLFLFQREKFRPSPGSSTAG